ncbi:hypothetical protein C5167_036993 [Papaver somniferum]|uniref:Uncharacterized protein n=1 Tax=Papaver somniferum TaxID=3469 RepID=A0A4Y7I8L2_PAPSO|nr:hypothetical protein C5167_036993 [Papaver somniferum]
MRKKVDDRIKTLIENGVKTRHRSIFVIVGDKSREQIVNLHYMLSKSVVKSRPTSQEKTGKPDEEVKAEWFT